MKRVSGGPLTLARVMVARESQKMEKSLVPWVRGTSSPKPTVEMETQTR
jgi:hypothetical protein